MIYASDVDFDIDMDLSTPSCDSLPRCCRCDSMHLLPEVDVAFLSHENNNKSKYEDLQTVGTT